MEQKTDEWFAARLGRVTASKVADATAKIKDGEAASRANYRAQLVAERLTGINQSADLSNNQAVQWGVDTEAMARAAYEFIHDVEVVEVGIIYHKQIEMTGASPDGLVNEDGVLEIKCPNTATHISYLKSDSIPSKYRKQMLWQIACTNRKWCDFVSFDPRLDAGNQLFVKRLEPTMEEIKSLEDEVKIFLAEVDAEEKWLIERCNKK